MGWGFDIVESGAERARLAVVGMGLIGRRHAGLIRDSGDADLVAVADPDPGSAAFASGIGVAHYRTLDELLARERPDGVVVATPSDLHVPHALACIAAGVPVLVEKPVATTVEDARHLADAAEAAGVPVLVGHHRRHSPILAAARRVVGSGALGDVVAVVATTLFAKPPAYFDAAPWRRRPGGGPILINLIHDIDALRMLAGEVLEVQAMASDRVRGFDVEDTAAVLLRFASGALGSLILSDAAASPVSWELTAGEDPAFPRHDDRDCYLIAGTRGTLGIPSLRLTTHHGEPSWTRPTHTAAVPVSRVDPLASQLQHFCRVITREVSPHVTVRDATETLRVTLAVSEAARAGRPVPSGPPAP